MTEQSHGTRSRIWLARVIAVVVGLFIANATNCAVGAPPALKLSVAGEAVVVFSYTRDRCDPSDIPDAPARAIRVASGQVQLYAPHFANRRLIGADTRHLSHDCRIVFQGAEQDEPAAFDDRGWIANLYTMDGRTVYATIHDEFQGHRRAALCPSGRYMDCWYNSLTSAVSHDSGLSFHRVGLIAALPYRYDALLSAHHGYFNPSNIVTTDHVFFMTAFTTQAMAQRPGNCLLRTSAVRDSGAWRAWDGHSFTVAFIDPYRDIGDPAAHVCSPVDPSHLRWPVTSLVRHRASGLFVALMQNGARDGGVFYATSANLLDWSEPTRLMDGIGEAAWWPGNPAPIAYPSLLDMSAPGRNFDSVGPEADLFLTRFNLGGGWSSMDRDLIRMPVRVSPARP